MNCAECKELLMVHLEGLLEESEKQAVQEHLGQCETCRAELEELQTLQRRLVNNGKVLAQSDLEDEVMNRIIREQNVRLKSTQGAGTGLRIRRLIMRSSLGRFAVAAAVVVACAGGLYLWSGTGPGGGLALADVLTQVQHITAYMYQMTMTVGGKGSTGIPMNQNVRTAILIARDYGMKITVDMTDPNSGKTRRQEQYILPQEKALFMVMPNEKKYVRMDLDDTLLAKIRQENYDPGTMLARVIECRYKSLGRSVIKGVEVEGFQTTDPNYLAGMAGQTDVKVWVDVRTQLPVRMEMDMTIGQVQMHGVTDDFWWNVAATAADFQPVIPDDYATLPGGPMKMPAMNEESAIAGLKLAADLTGRYPEKLDLMSLSAFIGKLGDEDNPALKQLAEESKGLSRNERTKKMMDITMPIQGAGMFYMLLRQEKKEPAYYGDIVAPGDIAQVLLRWKTADDKYRVIFADLHADTVTAEQLAQLEAALPK
jgi:hypothetical protein